MFAICNVKNACVPMCSAVKIIPNDKSCSNSFQWLCHLFRMAHRDETTKCYLRQLRAFTQYHGRKNKCIWIFSWLGLTETYHHEKMTTKTDVAFVVAIGSNRKYNRLLLSFKQENNEYIYI